MKGLPFFGAPPPAGADWSASSFAKWHPLEQVYAGPAGRAASVAAKLEPPATFHVLRHAFASLRVMAGMPLIAVPTS